MLNVSKVKWVKATPALVRTASEIPGLVIINGYPSLEGYLARAQSDALLHMDVVNPFTGEGKLWVSWGSSNYHMLYNPEEGVKAVVDLSSSYYDEEEESNMVLAWVQ